MRLIDEWKAQSSEGLLGFMEELSGRDDVYSVKCKGFTACLTDQDIYYYGKADEVVLVLVDTYNGPGETLDELPDENDLIWGKIPPLWYGEEAHRISPVYLMMEAVYLFQKGCKDGHLEIPGMHIVMLTGHRLIDYEKFVPVWEQLHTTVFHQVLDIEAILQVPVNKRDDMPEAGYFQNYIRKRDEGKVCSFLAEDKAEIEARKNFGGYSFISSELLKFSIK